ncbi:PEP-CTERM sorting domain-containing protein [Okeanomitos corallinicola TIOX110]|uniref:PEP-CTERM sorting domain-containing protein n=1 Tax=Okeanomitos corallinicola TIOX110 TaxID=3133117 RepID=A0ABZ2UXC3_9CYAN
MNSKLFGALAAATTLAGIVVTGGTANAASISYSANSGDFASTDFYDTVLSIQKFNSALGTLESVTLDITGNIKGDARFESLDAAATIIRTEIGADLFLNQGSTNLLTLNLSQSELFNATAFDGQIDFGGTSGGSFDNIMDQRAQTQTLTDNLGAFIGSGNIDFLLSATARSSITGSGNLATIINTLAKGELTVTYNYSATSVPEPSAFLGFGLIAGFGLLSQRKKSRFQISK